MSYTNGYGGYPPPPFGPYNVFWPGAPVPPTPAKPEENWFKTMMQNAREQEAYAKFMKKYFAEEKKDDKPKSKLSTIDWFMLLCALNSITVPMFIILGVKLFK